MAVDEAIFRSVLGSDSVATVRLYQFSRPTLSFGYAQRLREVCRPDACRELGVDCVRRPTGGRALLHEHELTYAVAAPARGIFARLSVREAYGVVSATLASGLSRLGVPLDRAPGPGALEARARSPRTGGAVVPCLAAPEPHELTSGGRKLVPSAQRRRRQGFLQHGSILTRVDPTLWERIRPVGDERPLAAVGLEELLPRAPEREELSEALVAAFEELFGEPPGGSELTPVERALARDLTADYRASAISPKGALAEC